MSSQSSSTSHFRILAVDDEEPILELYEDILGPGFQKSNPLTIPNKEGDAISSIDGISWPWFDVTLCRQGDEAIKAVSQSLSKNRPFSVIFLDVRMPPGPDGVWTAEQIRLRDPLVEIVIVTGFTTISPEEIALRVPPINKLLFLHKPFNIYEIRQFAQSLSIKWELEMKSMNIHRELERRVRERSRELARVNEELLKDIEKRQETEKALQRLNEELEQRVAERTAQLEMANQNLKIAIEQAEAAAIEAKAANRSKSEFLANMSHEIRTPMNGIIVTCDLVMATGLDEKQREYISIIRSSARSLLGLLNEILDFSKIEAGKLNLEQIPFCITSIVEEVYQFFSQNPQQKPVDFHLQIDPDVPRYVISDPYRLRQVLMNLMANAYKFTDSGHIYLSVQLDPDHKPVRFGSGTDVPLMFCVKDTGIGIPKEIQPHLFDAFVQADGSVTRKYGGTGLGLAICQQIIHLMGGRIWVESDPDKGSAFYFTATFKWADKTDGASEIRTLELQSQGTDVSVNLNSHVMPGVSILLVEDNPTNRKVVSELLTLAQIHVETATNGKEGIEKVAHNCYDAVLMDVQMPEVDGFAATKAIRALPGKAHLPIIAMTAHAMAGDRKKCLDAGMNDYVAKPINYKELFRVLKRVVGPIPDFSVQAQTDERSDLIIGSGEWDADIDVYDAVSRLGGSFSVFINVLDNFIDTHKDFSSQFKKVMADGDLERARILAHSLKGAAGNISAQPLAMRAKTLESACETGNQQTIEEILKDVDRILDRLLALKIHIQRQIDDGKKENGPDRHYQFRPTDAMDAVVQWFETLDLALTQLDPVITEACFQAVPFEDSDQVTHLLAKMEQHVNFYEFDEARQVLRQLRQLVVRTETS